MFKNPFNYYTKIHPENNNNTLAIKYGFLFIERKRKQRFLKIKKMRTQTVELDNVELNII